MKKFFQLLLLTVVALQVCSCHHEKTPSYDFYASMLVRNHTADSIQIRIFNGSTPMTDYWDFQQYNRCELLDNGAVIIPEGDIIRSYYIYIGSSTVHYSYNNIPISPSVYSTILGDSVQLWVGRTCLKTWRHGAADKSADNIYDPACWTRQEPHTEIYRPEPLKVEFHCLFDITPEYIDSISGK